MYKRFRDGLLSPKTIVEYIKDKMYKPIIQLLLYALIMTIPFFVNTITFKGMSYEEELAIREMFNDEIIPFEIVDGQLASTNNKTSVYNKTLIKELLSVRITIDEKSKDNENNTLYQVVFGREKIYIDAMGIKIDIGEYTLLEGMVNIKLYNLSNSNSEEWQPIVLIINQSLREFKRQTIVPSTIMSFIACYGYLLFVALLLAFSFRIRFRNLLSFKAMYKMSMYYTCPFVICYSLAILFNIGLLIWVGIAISFIYVFIGSSTIIKKLVSQGRE